MRFFVILCVIAVAAAQYDYAPQSGGDTGVGVGSIGGGYSSNGGSATRGSAQLSEPIQPANTEFNKEFYTYSAPEQDFDDAGANEQIANSIKRNLRVVFIKGPDNSALENAALQLAKSSSDDRTAIYVLSKQADISNLANQLQNLKDNNAHKPEVHFVKYRTEADAENAQRTIQSQYDALPGTSSNTNGGTAPVLNFASKAPAGSASQGQSQGSQYVPPAATYLPAGRRY